MKISILPLFLISTISLLTPAAANAETCAEYKYKGKQSKIEPTEKGLKIVTTAQAAVLADDKNLMEIFKTGGNFHSNIAKLVFSLPCEADEVAELYPTDRQAAKAVTFGIMYGAGAHKISQQVTTDSGTYFSKTQAQEVIDDYFRQFHKLKAWIDKSSRFIWTMDLFMVLQAEKEDYQM